MYKHDCPNCGLFCIHNPVQWGAAGLAMLNCTNCDCLHDSKKVIFYPVLPKQGLRAS